MFATKDGFLDAVRSSVPLILLYIVDGVPMTREPSDNKDDELLIWGRRNKLSPLGSSKTANMKKGRQQIHTFTIPDDSSVWMMPSAWPWFQPFTIARELRAVTSCWGFIIVSCPVDRPVHWLPRALMALLSMLSPRLPAKAAEIYKEENENLNSCTLKSKDLWWCLYLGIQICAERG